MVGVSGLFFRNTQAHEPQPTGETARFTQRVGGSDTFTMKFSPTGLTLLFGRKATSTPKRDWFPTVEFRQGSIGSCVGLSAYDALLNNELGRRYLNTVIDDLGAGNYHVKFVGYPRRRIIVTQSEIDNARGVKGSVGVQLLELAFNKLQQAEGKYLEPFFALTGTERKIVKAKDNAKLDFYIRHANQYTFVAGLGPEDIGFPDRKVNGHHMPAHHSYSFRIVKNNAGEPVFRIKNPHDTQNPFDITKAQFQRVFTEYGVFPISTLRRLMRQ